MESFTKISHQKQIILAVMILAIIGIAIYFHFLPLVFIFALIFLDKIVLSILRFPGFIGIELCTLVILLIALIYGVWPAVFIFVLIIIPLFDVFKILIIPVSEPPNPSHIIVDSFVWLGVGFGLIYLMNYIPFLVSALIMIVIKNIAFYAKHYAIGEIPNPTSVVGNIVFYYFFLLYIQEKILPLFLSI